MINPCKISCKECRQEECTIVPKSCKLFRQEECTIVPKSCKVLCTNFARPCQSRANFVHILRAFAWRNVSSCQVVLKPCKCRAFFVLKPCFCRAKVRAKNVGTKNARSCQSLLCLCLARWCLKFVFIYLPQKLITLAIWIALSQQSYSINWKHSSILLELFRA